MLKCAHILRFLSTTRNMHGMSNHLLSPAGHLLSSLKCSETCIKGHRSSTCKHTERPLYEIKKKGRPITQCSHCRELRKTRAVHVKCNCEGKEEPIPVPILTSPVAGSSKKGVLLFVPRITLLFGSSIRSSSFAFYLGSGLVLGTATFPNGLPKALEALVGSRTNSEPASSDSEHGGMCSISARQPLYSSMADMSFFKCLLDRHGCTCASGGDCECCTPRKSIPRKKTPSDTSSPIDNAQNPSLLSAPPPSHSIESRAQQDHIKERLQNYRPIYPRTSPDPSGPSHDPSSPTAHGYPSRQHAHENSFHPYSLRLHSRQASASPLASQPVVQDNDQSIDGTAYMDNFPTFLPPDWQQQYMSIQNPQDSFPVVCGCGDGCACPGCVHHMGNNDMGSLPSAYSTCTNQAGCYTCLDCTLRSMLPTEDNSLPPSDTALSIYNPQGQLSIDEWIRQIPTIPSTTTYVQSDFQVDPNLFTSWNSVSSEAQTDPSVSSASCANNCGNDCQCPGVCACENADPRQICRVDSADYRFDAPTMARPTESFWADAEAQGGQSTESLGNMGQYLFDRFNQDSVYYGSGGGNQHLSQSAGDVYPPTGRGNGVPLSRQTTITQQHVQSTPSLIQSIVRSLTSRRSASSTSSSTGGPDSRSPSTYAQSNPDSDASWEAYEQEQSPYDSSTTMDRLQLY